MHVFLCCGRMFSPVARFCSQGHPRLKELPVNMQSSFQLPCLGPASYMYDMMFCCRLFVYSEYSVFRTLAYWLFLQLNPDLQLMPSHTTVLSFFNRFVPFSHTTAPSPSSQVCTIFTHHRPKSVLTGLYHFHMLLLSPSSTGVYHFDTVLTFFSPTGFHHFHTVLTFFNTNCTICALSFFSTCLYCLHTVLTFFNRFVPCAQCPCLFQQVCTIFSLSSPFSTGLYHLRTVLTFFIRFVPFAQSSHFQLVCAICTVLTFSTGLCHFHTLRLPPSSVGL